MARSEALSKKQARREWKRHSCGPGKPERFNDRKVGLETVRHIAHIGEAQRILADGQVSASLVCDESRLKATRTSVVWLSANDWSAAPAGSIYGCVEFVFDWQKIVAEYPHIYWVEEMPYRPPAYRFLLAREEVCSDLMVEYDPCVAEGPLMLEEGEWFWNRQHTSEFMIADNVDLEGCERMGFVRHRKCRKYGGRCPDRELHEKTVMLFVLAYVLASGAHGGDRALLARDAMSMNQLDQFINRFCEVAGEWCGSRVKVEGAKTLRAAVRAVLALWSYRDVESAERLIGLFPNRERLRSTLCAVVAEHLGCDSYRARTVQDYLADRPA